MTERVIKGVVTDKMPMTVKGKRHFAKITIKTDEGNEDRFLGSWSKDGLKEMHDIVVVDKPIELKEFSVEKEGETYWNAISIKTEKGEWNAPKPKPRTLSIDFNPLISRLDNLQAKLDNIEDKIDKLGKK